MNRFIVAGVISAGFMGFLAQTTIHADDDGAKALKDLEGVWASTPAKKGRDRGHILIFQGSRMGWQSFQTLDGEPLIGHGKLYDIKLDPKAIPKQITANMIGTDRDETRRGIYELDGDTLKIAFSIGLDGERPKKFDEKDAGTITLTKDKKAKVPDLSKATEEQKKTPVEPVAKWLGRIADADVSKQLPEKPVTTAAEFEKVWKILRGKEELPKVDFTKEFVVVDWTTFGKVTAFKLIIVEGEEKASQSSEHQLSEEELKKGPQGLSYFIGVFRRERVDVVNGKIMVKGKN